MAEETRDTPPATPGQRSETEDELQRGDRIEANYKGKGKWYKGKIDRVNSNGTFDSNEGGTLLYFQGESHALH